MLVIPPFSYLSVAFLASLAVVRGEASDDPKAAVQIPDFAGPDVKCKGNHAGWSESCGLLDDTFLASQATPQRDSKGRYYICKDTCCAVAVHKEGPDVLTESSISIWANNANMHCNGPNLQTWRSAVQQSWPAPDGGKYKICMCNKSSMGSC